MRDVTRRGEQVIRKEILVKKYALSERQAVALDYLLEHKEITIRDYIKLCSQVNRRSLQRDLKAMVDKNLLIERGSSPTDPTKRYKLII
jgi:DNA-binding MarR family transcriptional regulator